jgi:trans-aconitate 2-methyltransferase
MLSKARERLRGMTFEEADLTAWWPDERFNLIFASGVLHWLPDQQRILTRLVSFLHDGGCLAVQVPNTVDEPCHRSMQEVASDGPWAGKLSAASLGKERSGTIDEFYAHLQQMGCTCDLWETTYFHPLAGPGAIVEWFEGSELRRYLKPLTVKERPEFLSRYQAALAKAYRAQTEGKVLLRMPRVFFVAQRSRTRKSIAPWSSDPGAGRRTGRVVEMEPTTV